MSAPALYLGQVMHCRLRPFRHRFVYRVFSILLDIDRLEEQTRRTRLFSIDRFNLFSLHRRDHGPRDGGPLRPWVERELERHGLTGAGRRIELLCFPRLLGYVFDPLSIYFVHHPDGRLESILYEVKNTFGGQHCYALPVEQAPGQLIRHSCTKAFFVSPFIGMESTYDFRLREPGDQLFVSIAQSVPEGKQLLASQTGLRRPLTDRSLLRALVHAGPLTFKVIAGIHWEALKLWLRGARFHSPSAVPEAQRGTQRPAPLARGG